MEAYNNSLANVLLILLATSFFSVDARKLTEPKAVFTLNLIHRDSPNSPFYDPSITPLERLKRAPFGSISHAHNIHLSSKYYDTLNNAELSSLIPNGGGYLIQIMVGTPPVQVNAIADTGSNLIWTQSPQCDSCSPQHFPLYDPNKSSTFQTISCSSSACTSNPYLETECPDNAVCEYTVGYGDGSKTSGILATDTITIPSLDATSLSIPSSVFGCELAQKGQSDEAGIVGLGPNPTSLISQLGPNIDYKFSYCLAPLTSGVNSKLTFGADVMGPGLVSTPFTTGQYSNNYYITLESITVSANDSPVEVNVGQDDVVIDSGTTLTFLPTNVYGGIRDALTNAIGLTPVDSPVEGYDLCYETSSGQQLNSPDLVFHFSGADVVLKEINTFQDIGNGSTCLAMGASENNYIFGNIAQVNYQVEYDLKAMQISFAPADCTT